MNNEHNCNIIFFDNQCAFCSFWVNFVNKKDKNSVCFKYSPINGEYFNKTFPSNLLSSLPDSIVVFNTSSEILTQSSAVKFILSKLGIEYQLLALIISCIPQRWADYVYTIIARNRRRYFRQSCSIDSASKELAEKYIP